MYFSILYLFSGYFQMALEVTNQSLTSFITPLGQHKWKRLPMGLSSAPGAFQSLKDSISAGVSYEML